jgi:predicted RNA-binding Zn ribbon-like protein
MARSGGVAPPRRARRSLAIDLANTVACRGCRGGDALASVGDATRWLRTNLPGRKSGLTPADLAPLRRFRAELREVISAAVDRTRPPPSCLVAVNRAAGRAPARLLWNPRGWSVTEDLEMSSTREQVMVLSARDAVGLLGRTSPLPVRRCEGPECIHFLLARTGRQKWCSPTGCGNRVRVQRHYQKIHASEMAVGGRAARGHLAKTT